MISSMIQAIKIQPNMSEQEKKHQKIHDLLNVETKPKKIPKQLEFLYILYQA